MNNIKTESIRIFLSALENSNLDSIKELSIDRFSISSEIQEVDLNDLKYFQNLEGLTLINLSLSYEDFEILESLKNLQSLKLINCELLDDNINFSNMYNLRRLCLNNININLSKLDMNLELLEIKNMEYKANSTYSEVLDISKANYDVKELDEVSVEKIIINHSKYYDNKIYFDNLASTIHIIVKEDDYDAVEVEL